MSAKPDQRPPVWVGHVALHTPLVTETSEFMLQLGMRQIARDDGFAVLEMRGGTHLILTKNPNSSLLRGRFDLMVEDLDATHAQLRELGFDPGDIERGEIHDNFEVREPGGSVILFNSSHVGKLPV